MNTLRRQRGHAPISQLFFTIVGVAMIVCGIGLIVAGGWLLYRGASLVFMGLP